MSIREGLLFYERMMEDLERQAGISAAASMFGGPTPTGGPGDG